MKPMNAHEYRRHREDEIGSHLRLHRYYRMRRITGRLPDDLGSDEYTLIAREAVEREARILAAMGVRRLAPGEGPQPVASRDGAARRGPP